MRHWRPGVIDRSKVPHILRAFAPVRSVLSLPEIDLDDLHAQGKRLILLDLDHTLVPWHSDDVPELIAKWIKDALAKSFEICVLSNTHRPDRLLRITGMHGIKVIRGRAKPSRTMFRRALEQFACRPEEAVMIGDQLVTDILGANRSGIDGIWVRKMDGKEFAGTYLNRLVERLVVKPIYYLAMVVPNNITTAEEPDSPRTSLARQVIKFLIVGGTSFVINYGITFTLMKVIRVGNSLLSVTFGLWLIQHYPNVFAFANRPDIAAFPFLNALASVVAMYNSFLLNRAWTFRVQGKGQGLAQVRRFYTVTITGQLITVGLATTLFNVIPGTHALFLSNFLATVVGAVWNFLGQRYYAFRVPTVSKLSSAE